MRRWASALPRRSPPHQLCRRSSAAAQAAARRRPARAPQAATLPRGALRAVVKGRGRRVRASGGRSKASQAGRAPPSWLAATWAQKAGELARGVAKAAGATCAPGEIAALAEKSLGGCLAQLHVTRHARRGMPPAGAVQALLHPSGTPAWLPRAPRGARSARRAAEPAGKTPCRPLVGAPPRATQRGAHARRGVWRGDPSVCCRLLPARPWAAQAARSD